MIKIELTDIPNLRLEYDALVGPKVIFRLTCLQLALQHILGHKEVLPPKDHLKEVGTVVKKIVKIATDKTLAANRFNKKPYRRTVLLYRRKIVAAGTVDCQKVLDLVTELLDPANGKLYHLLTCTAEELFKTNKGLLQKPNKLGAFEKEVLKLAFDYGYADVADLIKSFFRSKNFVTYCPYCNQDPAMYSGLATGATVRVHQLDHFFDKASYPLLCYSMFNLVPGDWTCNTINKRDKPFSDRYHLNPYTDGFGKTMVFEPDYDQAGSKMIEIRLTIDPAAALLRRRQLLGSDFRIDETEAQGNINVFGLKKKYNEPHIWLEAGRVHRKFLYNLNNHASLKKMLAQLPLTQAFDQYKYWYEEDVRAPFESARFNDQRYSKLFRDIHDFVVKQDGQPQNKVIKDITELYI